LLLQGQEVLKREVAALLARSLAAEQLAADRLAALTAQGAGGHPSAPVPV